MDQRNKRSFGSLGEEIAAASLVRDGSEILCRNFRVGRLGEIDIIAREKEYICFIEVKTRSSTLYGRPSEAVNLRKRETIRRLAEIFLQRHHFSDLPLRFDVAEVLLEKWRGGFRVKSVQIIKNAF